MKNIIAFLLDLNINIYILISNMAEKRQFNCAIGAIECYKPIKLLKHVKSIFF